MREITAAVPESSLIALLAAFFLGLQVLIVDRGMAHHVRRGGHRPALAAAFVTLLGSVSILWTLVVLRGALPRSLSPLTLLPFLVAGVADPALTRFLYYEGIERVGPSIASAITAGSPAVAALVAVPVLGEHVTPPGVVGLAFVVGGIAGLQLVRGNSTLSGPQSLVSTGFARVSLGEHAFDVLYPVGAMVLIGTAFVVTKIGLRGLPNALLATAVTQTAALFAFLVAFGVSPATRRRAVVSDRTTLAIFLVAGVVLAMGWFAMFLALQLGSVVVVLPLVSLYPLVVVLVSYGVAREIPRSPHILLAIGAILLGAILVQST